MGRRQCCGSVAARVQHSARLVEEANQEFGAVGRINALSSADTSMGLGVRGRPRCQRRSRDGGTVARRFALSVQHRAGACADRRHTDAAHRSRHGEERDEVADMATATLLDGYLTKKVITLDGGLLPR